MRSSRRSAANIRISDAGVLEKQHALGRPFEFNFVDLEVKNGSLTSR